MTKSPWGLDGIQERTKQATEAQMDEIRKECSIYAAVFNSSEGQKVLNVLEKTLNKPTWSPDKGESYGYYREGQNSIIRDIISRVNLAKEF